MEPTKTRRLVVVVATLIVAVMAAFAVHVSLNRASSQAAKKQKAQQSAMQKVADDAVAKGLKKAAGEPARSVKVYQQILPSVVVITTDEAKPQTPDTTPKPDDEKVGIGAGVIISKDGSILTANHVIADAKSISVSFADGTEAKGEVVSQDPSKDTAVLKTDRLPQVLVPAVMGGGVRVGDDVYAVGHPLGLAGSFSAGVVSGLDRSVPIKDKVTLKGLIQFDAAVNPGNSGGPLLNRNGQVVGIVTALANPSNQPFFSGIGFAVPIGAAAGGVGPGGAPQL